MMSSMKARWAVVAMLAVTMALTFSPTAGSASKNDADDLRASVLTAVWWQWLYSVPLAENPSFDATGQFAFRNQPFDRLIFLAGTSTSFVVNGNVFGTAERSITVPRGTAFFFPLINTEIDNVMFDTPTPGTASVVNTGPNSLTIPQMQALAASFVSGDTGLFCTLTPLGGNTVNVPYERVKSPVFPYYLPPGNIYEAYGEKIQGIVWPAVADGYWSSIPPLPHGTYTLHFGGSQPIGGGNSFSLDITYHITVK